MLFKYLALLTFSAVLMVVSSNAPSFVQNFFVKFFIFFFFIAGA